jgi:hypothetical protein
MTEPAAFDPQTTPTISIAGKEWPIPELVWKDLRKCRKELIELNRLVGATVDGLEVVEDEPVLDRAVRQMAAMAEVFHDLSNDDFERLVMGPVLAGLQAAHPSLTPDEFYGWTIAEADRQLAWMTVRRQSGLFIFRGEASDDAQDQADADPGEAAGAA